MSLLAPAGLATLLLLPVIVVMHLWRVRYRRHDLSSTLLWSRVLTETPLRRPRRLPTRFILLALQLAALCCGGLALARPAWVAAGQHRHLVAAVDTSLAMSAADGPHRRTRLNQAVGDVQTLIDHLSPGDTMTLVDLGTEPRVLVTSDDGAALSRALAQLHQGYGPSSLANDGALLAGLTTSGGARTVADIFVPIGTAGPVVRALRVQVAPLAVHTLGASAADRAVANLSVACEGGRCEAFARLINTAASPIGVRVSVTVDDGRGPPQQGTREVTLAAASSTPIGLPLPRGARTVQLRLDGHDALTADDAAWAVVPTPVRRHVLLVTNDAASPLALALRAIPNVTLTTVADDTTYNDGMTQRVDLTVLDNTGPDIQPPGNLLVVNPANGAGLFTLGGAVSGSGSLTADAADPLLAGVDLSSLVVSTATRVRVPPWAHIVVDADGVPLLFSGVVGGRRVAVLTFDPRAAATSNASNFSSLLAFPTFLQGAVTTLAPAPSLAVPTGARAAIAVGRQGAPWLQAQTGRAQALPSSGDVAALPPLRAGLYTYNGGAGGVGQLAANAMPPTDPGAPPGPDVASAAPPAPTVIAPAFLTPLEGWAVLALLGLFVLGAEWWYYVRRT